MLLRRKLFLSGTVLSVLLCFSSIVTVDAASMWSLTYGGAGDDVAYSVVETPYGGYVVAGGTTSFGAGSDDSWLVKTDALGNIEWNRTYGETNHDVAYSLVKASDGGYALAGAWDYSTALWEPNFFIGGDFWLIKTNANGVLEWDRKYGGIENDVAYSLVATPDGGYALAGIRNYTILYGLSYYGDFWLVKTDEFGNMQWNQTYGEKGAVGEYAYSLVVTPDGGYAIAGLLNLFSGIWLVKTDSLGNMQWNRTYSALSDWTYSHCSLIATSDGGYAIAGTNITLETVVAGSFLVKTDSFGNVTWSRTYEGLSVASLIATSDGGYALAGDSFLIKTDAFGNVQWNRTYADGSINSLVATSDGGYAIAGYTSSFDAGGNDFWLMKTDELGVVPEGLTIGVMLVLSTVAVIVGLRYYRKRPKWENW